MNNATLEKIEKLGEVYISFGFKPDTAIEYTAGQFIELAIPHSNPDDRGEKRWFTLSSSPNEQLLTVTTKISHPSSSFKQAMLNMQPGARVHISQAMGDFVLPLQTTIPLVFACVGAGITPVRSMLATLKSTGDQRNIKVLYGVENEGQLLFTQLLEEKSSVKYFLKSKGSKLTAAAIAEELSANNCYVYLSGPEHFVEQAAAELGPRLSGAQLLLTDYFHGYN